MSLNLIKILEQEVKPLSVRELEQKLNDAGFTKNISSVYRQLEKLIKDKLVEKVFLSDGITRYEMNKDEYIHFFCTNAILCYVIL